MTYNKEYYKKYVIKNREKINAKQRLWSKENPEKRKKYVNNWRNKNKEAVKILKHRSYLKNRTKIIESVKKYYLKNKERLDNLHKISSKKYRKKNKEKINITIKKWQLKNKEKIQKLQNLWINKNRKRVNYLANIRIKKYRILNLNYRINQNIGIDIWHALKQNKNGKKWQTLVGYSVEDLKNHLEKSFDDNMKWNNYGSYWSIDHIKPRSLFNFKNHTDKEFKECWALENLQPLEKIANIKKGNKYHATIQTPTTNSGQNS